VVYPATPDVPWGILQPVGIVKEIPPELMDSLAVYTNVSVLPVEFTRIVDGDVETLAEPDPSIANTKRQDKKENTATAIHNGT